MKQNLLEALSKQSQLQRKLVVPEVSFLYCYCLTHHVKIVLKEGNTDRSAKLETSKIVCHDKLIFCSIYIYLLCYSNDENCPTPFAIQTNYSMYTRTLS